MRYFVAILMILGLITLAFVLLLQGGGKKAAPPKPLFDYADTTAQMQLLIDGPINSSQVHQQVRITVGRDQSTLAVLSGYQDKVTRIKSYNNDSSSYNAFLHSLQLAGFTKGNNDPTLRDYSGHCPLGDRYVFSANEGSNLIEQYWTTSCGGGTFGGSLNLNFSLFQAQIPDYANLTQNLKI